MSTEAWVERVLGRSVSTNLSKLDTLPSGVWLVTGANGSIGAAVVDLLERSGVRVVATDIDTMDVTDAAAVRGAMREHSPSVVLHLAGAKHAPEGELDPLDTLLVNSIGTQNVLGYAPYGCRVVTASTCKACDPETAYGASKLIAERLTLNAGHRVARFHNVVETSGNVFEIWENLDADDPIPVSDGLRYFLAREEALELLLHAACAPEAGRYSYDPGIMHQMRDVAHRLYPNRRQFAIARRGDRATEKLCATNETHTRVHGTTSILRVEGLHDAPATRTMEVAA